MRAKDKTREEIGSNSIGGGCKVLGVSKEITCSSPTCFGPSEFYSLKQPSLSPYCKIAHP